MEFKQDKDELDDYDDSALDDDVQDGLLSDHNIQDHPPIESLCIESQEEKLTNPDWKPNWRAKSERKFYVKYNESRHCLYIHFKFKLPEIRGRYGFSRDEDIIRRNLNKVTNQKDQVSNEVAIKLYFQLYNVKGVSKVDFDAGYLIEIKLGDLFTPNEVKPLIIQILHETFGPMVELEAPARKITKPLQIDRVMLVHNGNAKKPKRQRKLDAAFEV